MRQKKLPLDDAKKQMIENNKSFIVWGLDNTTSWTLDTKEGEGQVLFDHKNPLIALYQIEKVLLNEIMSGNQ